MVLQEEGRDFCYLWYNCDHDFTISGEVESHVEVLIYFSMGNLHQTRNVIDHTFIGFLQQVSHLDDYGGVYMAVLEVIHMPEDSELFILENIICDT